MKTQPSSPPVGTQARTISLRAVSVPMSRVEKAPLSAKKFPVLPTRDATPPKPSGRTRQPEEEVSSSEEEVSSSEEEEEASPQDDDDLPGPAHAPSSARSIQVPSVAELDAQKTVGTVHVTPCALFSGRSGVVELKSIKGEGSHSRVFQALAQPRNSRAGERSRATKVVAVKMFSHEDYYDLEVGVMRRLADVHGPSSHKMLHHWREPPVGGFHMMYACACTDLHQLVSKDPNFWDFKHDGTAPFGSWIYDPSRVFGMLASGLEALHGAGVVHYDVKAPNVLVYKDRLQLCDFSLAEFRALGTARTKQPDIYHCTSYCRPPEGRLYWALVQKNLLDVGHNRELPPGTHLCRATAQYATSGESAAAGQQLESRIIDLYEDLISAGALEGVLGNWHALDTAHAVDVWSLGVLFLTYLRSPSAHYNHLCNICSLSMALFLSPDKVDASASETDAALVTHFPEIVKSSNDRHRRVTARSDAILLPGLSDEAFLSTLGDAHCERIARTRDQAERYWDVISSMLHHNPDRRPTAAQVVAHMRFIAETKVDEI